MEDIKMEDIKMERINIRLAKVVKDWYMFEAKTMGMNMTQYIAFVLSTHYKNSVNQQTLIDLNNLAKSDEIMNMNKQLLEIMQSTEIEKKDNPLIK